MKRLAFLTIAFFLVLTSAFAAQAEILFQDDFDDGNLDGWTHIADWFGDDHGEWSVVNVGGNWVLKFDADPVAHYASFLVADDVVAVPESFILEFDATTLLNDQGMHYIAAYMHFYDHDTHLIGGVRQQGDDLFLIQEINNIRHIKMKIPFSIEDESAWHHHKYVKEGKLVSFYFDDVLKYSYELPEPISGGGLALCATEGTHFDNVVIRSPGINDGLIAYYPFSGNAKDESGNGHDGTVSGASLEMDRFGNPNSAYVFDGIDDYINIAGSSDFSLSSWTIAGWIKINDNPGLYSSNIVGKMSTTDHYNFQVSFLPEQRQPPNVIVSGYETCDDEFDHPLVFYHSPLHEWIFFASVRDDNSGRNALYINGEEVGEGVWPDDSPCLDDTDLRIGHKFEPNSVCFNGAIDDVRIYNRALSEAEIQGLFGFTPEPPPLPPVADAGLDQIVPDVATLDGSGSSDPDGTIESYLWELNHRDPDHPEYDRTANGESPTVSGLELGFYDVTLTVTDNDGLTATDTMLIAVAGPCAVWPEPNTDFNLKKFKMKKNKNGKREGKTNTKISGSIDLPELDVVDGDTVEARITIELFDAIPGGLVMSEEVKLNVKDRKGSLELKK